jgi:adenine-specific DNA-methyltransferase
MGTLRPCPDESVDWDTTQNLMIEGDNLEVLKLLQKSYAGKVKLIYIDPPYNTGKDFVYTDNYQESIQNYLELIGQVEGGPRLSSNKETSGRFHTVWLNMMYPRLMIARNLLREDGGIICSIGDEEIAGMAEMLSEIFGDENCAAHLCIVRSEGGGLAKQVVKGHDYLLVYAKNLSSFAPLRRPKEIRGGIISIEGDEFWIEEDWLRKKFGTYGTCEYGDVERYFGAAKKMEIDEGLGAGKYRLVEKRNGTLVVGRLRKVEDDSSKFYSVQKHLNASSADDLDRIGMPTGVFDFPKPLSLLTDVVLGTTFHSKAGGDIVVDFFAGSGTTGHAVMAQNAADGGCRRHILVQLPARLDPGNINQNSAAEFCDRIGHPPNLAELTKERLRRAAETIKAHNPRFVRDTGFRVFKLDSSNIRAWNPDADNLDQTLLDSVEHLNPGRSETDVLYEILLKRGLDLCASVETRLIANHKVYAVGGGAIFACLTERIVRADVEPIAAGIVDWHKTFAAAAETTIIFRDSAFEDDVAKTNLVAILKQAGLSNVRSL